MVIKRKKVLCGLIISLILMSAMPSLVIRRKASQIEIEGADALIENLFTLTGNIHVVKFDAEIAEHVFGRAQLDTCVRSEFK